MVLAYDPQLYQQNTIETIQTHTPMAKWFLTKIPQQSSGEGKYFQQMTLEQVTIHIKKDELWDFPGGPLV